MADSIPPGVKESVSPSRDGIQPPVAFFVPPGSEGLRLDVVLRGFLPGLGLRASRRLWEWCSVTVNGRGQKPGYIVSAGDEIRLEHGKPSCESLQEKPADVSLLALSRDYAAFGKPEGLHSARIAGSRNPSLEGMLGLVWPELWRRWIAAQAALTGDMAGPLPPSAPRLLTRLDKATSGLILAARHPAAADGFRLRERQGLVEKTYVAVVRGKLEQALCLTWGLNTANRARTLVLDGDDPDPARHTSVVPVVFVNICRDTGHVKTADAAGARNTLVRVRIQRGARHQIRAHLAKAGFPLLGEWLYAPGPGAPGRLFLHHARIDFPGFTAEQAPEWLNDPDFLPPF